MRGYEYIGDKIEADMISNCKRALLATGWAFGLLLPVPVALAQSSKGPVVVADSPRPVYHLTAPHQGLGPVTGMAYHQGRFHLYYQQNPSAAQPAKVVWGHASSKDLLHWNALPIALAGKDTVTPLAGTAIFDPKDYGRFRNKAGLFPLHAFFTGHSPNRDRIFQVQSYDGGKSFTPWAVRKAVLGGQVARLSDPKVLPFGEQWRMLVIAADQKAVQVFASDNLKQWRQVGAFTLPGDYQSDWQYPDLITVKDQYGRNHWVFLLSTHLTTLYWFGSFDGKRFIPYVGQAAPQRLDAGPDYFAARSCNNAPATPDGQPIIMAWNNHPLYADAIPQKPFRGMMSMPHLVRARMHIRGGYSLVRSPFPSIDQAMKDTTAALQEFDIKLPKAGKVQFLVKRSELEKGMVLLKHPSRGDIRLQVKKDTLVLDRSNWGGTTLGYPVGFGGVYANPFVYLSEPKDSYFMQLYIDQGMAELYIDGGRVVCSFLYLTTESDNFATLPLSSILPGSVKVSEMRGVSSIHAK